MKITEFENVLISRDGMSKDDASEAKEECMERVLEGESPEEILNEYGLEPDYIFDIMP